MTAQAMTPYNRGNPPDDVESYKRYVEEEFRRIERVMRDIEAAVVQLQEALASSTVLPITL